MNPDQHECSPAAAPKKLNVFERYLSVWVLVCINTVPISRS